MNSIMKHTARPGALTGLAARKAALEATGAVDVSVREKSANEMKHRIGIVFDNSGSMYGKQLEDAKAGIEEFLRSCTKDQTAVAVAPLHGEALLLSKHLPAVAVMCKAIEAAGGTPLVQTAKKMLNTNRLTRAIIFSDGAPNDYDFKPLLVDIPIDTVYIPEAGYISESAEKFLRDIAEATGGIYLRFESGKSNFRTAFKYLSPGLRYMLADKSFVQKLEGR